MGGERAALVRVPSGLALEIPRDPKILIVAPATASATVHAALAPLRSSSLVDVVDCDAGRAAIGVVTPDLLLVAASCDGAVELCRQLKSQLQTSTIPVILFDDDDGGDGAALRQAAIDAGCDHWHPAGAPSGELYSRSLHLLRSRGLFRALFDANHQLRMRGDWVRYLVHDLRNALGIITANFDFVAESLSDRNGDVALAISEGTFGARRMGALLQDMLDVDRIQRGELKPQLSRFDAAEALHGSAAQVRPLASARGVRLSVAAASVQVEADRALLDRMLANLAGNAVRYARSRISLVAEAQTGAVRIVVANDGPPIPEAFRDRIFLPFIQLEGPSRHGAGLGLAFCRLAAEMHGGRLALAGAADGDVRFELTLPQRGRAREQR